MHCKTRSAVVLPSLLRNESQSLMAQHLVNDLLRWKGFVLVARANVAESQGTNEVIKALKVMEK